MRVALPEGVSRKKVMIVLRHLLVAGANNMENLGCHRWIHLMMYNKEIIESVYRPF